MSGRRAVVPASGYYEWRVVDGAKTPFYLSLPGDELMLFAGLYEWWRNPAAAADDPGRWLLSASFLTRESTGALRGVHDRMPVFLDSDLVEEWLDPQSEGTQELVDQVAAGGAEVAQRVEFHEVGNRGRLGAEQRAGAGRPRSVRAIDWGRTVDREPRMRDLGNGSNHQRCRPGARPRPDSPPFTAPHASRTRFTRFGPGGRWGAG